MKKKKGKCLEIAEYQLPISSICTKSIKRNFDNTALCDTRKELLCAYYVRANCTAEMYKKWFGGRTEE